MLRHFVTDTDECADNPCVNNGTCVDLVNAYECICLAGFNSSNCSTSTILKNLLNSFLLVLVVVGTCFCVYDLNVFYENTNSKFFLKYTRSICS